MLKACDALNCLLSHQLTLFSSIVCADTLGALACTCASLRRAVARLDDATFLRCMLPPARVFFAKPTSRKEAMLRSRITRFLHIVVRSVDLHGQRSDILERISVSRALEDSLKDYKSYDKHLHLVLYTRARLSMTSSIETTFVFPNCVVPLNDKLVFVERYDHSDNTMSVTIDVSLVTLRNIVVRYTALYHPNDATSHAHQSNEIAIV